MLFLLNRYVALVGNVYGLIGIFLPVSVVVLYFTIQLTWQAHDSFCAEVRLWFLNVCLLLTRDLAVRHTRYRDKRSFFYKH